MKLYTQGVSSNPSGLHISELWPPRGKWNTGQRKKKRKNKCLQVHFTKNSPQDLRWQAARSFLVFERWRRRKGCGSFKAQTSAFWLALGKTNESSIFVRGKSKFVRVNQPDRSAEEPVKVLQTILIPNYRLLWNRRPRQKKNKKKKEKSSEFFYVRGTKQMRWI